MININWTNFWDNKASEDFIQSTGKTSERTEDFYLYIYEIIKNLKGINKKDIILDVGGGAGYLTYCLSPLVNRLYSFDFSKKMVKKSIALNKNNKNVIVYKDNILSLKNQKFKKKIITKIIVGSVLQYLKNYSEIDNVFKNLKKISSDKTIILFTHNPDLQKKKFFIKSYKKLNWSKNKILRRQKLEQKRFWLDFDELKKIAKNNQFEKIQKIKIDRRFFQSTHMYDFLLMKKNV